MNNLGIFWKFYNKFTTVILANNNSNKILGQGT